MHREGPAGHVQGPPQGRVLIIAGSDSSGGAGIQADLKTVEALSGYGMTAVTAITAQNTRGVSDIHMVPEALISSQIKACLTDIGADVVKVGMLGDAETVHTVADALSGFTGPLVIDPVMVATSGDRLSSQETLEALKNRLIPGAEVITPNIPEAELLTDQTITTPEDMMRAASSLLTLGPQAVVLKGGHLTGDTVIDLLVTRDGAEGIEAPRQETVHTHGTGCSFASAIAALLAQGEGLADAFALAHQFVARAISEAPGFGAGHGPLGHAKAGQHMAAVRAERERPQGAVPFERKLGKDKPGHERKRRG